MATSPHSSLLLYEYETLSEQLAQIRVLRLLPGERGTPIHVVIETVGFAEASERHLYEALSYTWGTQNHESYVYVEGLQTTTFAVTPNLEEALDHLRLDDNLRTLWVDAICINQSDPLEKSKQVSQMTEIYANAARVIAWLGPEANDSDIAMDAFEEINKHVVVNSTSWTLAPRSEDSHWNDGEQKLPFEEFQMSALNHLLSRKWFSRLWVWQEVHLGADRSILVCGDRQISWLQFKNAFAVIFIKPKAYSVAAQELHFRLPSLGQLCSRSSFTFLEALWATRNCECTDPRDRVYAINGLVDRERRHIQIVADYTQTTQEVYTRLALDFADAYGDLQFLLYMAEENVTPGLPSWVPDWAASSAVNPTEFCASAGSRHQRRLIDHRKLSVKGVIVSAIDRVVPYALALSEEVMGLEREEALCHLVERIVPEVESTTLKSIEAILPDICRVLCGKTFRDSVVTTNPKIPSFAECKAVLEDLIASGRSNRVFRDLVYEAVDYHCRGRSFFISKDGRFGLARSLARCNDLITVLLGCGFAVVLRPAGEHYTFVGDAIYEGIMYGETLLGPLPEDFEVYHNGAHPEFPIGSLCFYSRSSKIVQWEDPRLPSLPPAWERIAIPGSAARFRHIETGETRDPRSDPRLDAAFLKDQGIKLEDFELA